MVHCALEAGDNNTIVIDTDGSGIWGPDIDRVIIPIS